MSAHAENSHDSTEARNIYFNTRSNARPENSLFGSTLEKVDQKATKAIDTTQYERDDMRKRMEYKAKYELHLPSRFHDKTAQEAIESEKHKIEAKEKGLTERQIAIKSMEEQAKYFQSLPKAFYQKEKAKTLIHPGLNMELSKQINTTGFTERHSYNRDKYEPMPPVHQYTLIGDPLRQGMDFAVHQSETRDQFKAFTFKAPDARPFRQKELSPRRLAPAATLSTNDSLDIPANIRAMFGTKIVDQLLSDKQAVEKTKQSLVQDQMRMKRPYEVEPLPVIETNTPQNYSDLSHALRMDKFSGHTFFQPSLQKDTHTYDVFARRYKDPDEFRHQWDEYGKWAAMNLLREQQKKEYDALLVPKAT